MSTTARRRGSACAELICVIFPSCERKAHSFESDVAPGIDITLLIVIAPAITGHKIGPQFETCGQNDSSNHSSEIQTRL